jgi:UDP-2-acetamido-3-amino-2,3-dideoxy-glucuronate N-acetyltransferase
MISESARIEEYVVIRRPVTIGERVRIGPFSFIRENTALADDVNIGDRCMLMGDLSIGKRTRLHSAVHISKGTRIGSDCFLAPFVVTTNVKYPLATNPGYRNKVEGVHIEDRVKIGAGAKIAPGVSIGHDSLIGLGAVVTKNVFPYSVVVGNPAKQVRDIRNLVAYKALKRGPRD